MNNVFFQIAVCFFAGAGAGLGTGFAGLSAATVISPMLITFLDIPAYDAIGIALASDVLASAVSARTYARSGAIDIRNGIAMMVGVLSMTVVGSWLSTYVENRTLSNFSVVMALLLGIRFLLFPMAAPKEKRSPCSERMKAVKGLIGGAGVGLVCGFFGAGGGMMMLMVLTTVLGYELKKAVGTSVFVMTFSALTGALSHFALGSVSYLGPLALCILFTLVWAQIGSKIATQVSLTVLNRLTSIILTSVGVLLLLIELL